MIIGIGTDLVSIDRVASVITRHGNRFIDRCFALDEQKSDHDPAHYAKRWAAKEAVAKALGLGIDAGVYLRDIVVLKDVNGAPRIDLRGGAARVLRDKCHPGRSEAETRDLLQAQEQMKIPDHPPSEGVRDDNFFVRIHLSLSDDAGFALAFVVIDQ